MRACGGCVLQGRLAGATGGGRATPGGGGVEGVREAMVRLAPTAHAVQASQCVCITLYYRKMLVESYRMHSI